MATSLGGGDNSVAPSLGGRDTFVATSLKGGDSVATCLGGRDCQGTNPWRANFLQTPPAVWTWTLIVYYKHQPSW